MNRDAAIAAGLLIALGIVVVVAMEEEASAEPVGPFPPGPGPGPGPGPVGPIIAKPAKPPGPIIAVPVEPPILVGFEQIPIADLFVAGSICQVDAGTYNRNQWPDPATVAHALTILGFPVTPTLKNTGDADQVMSFQLRARELSLEGMQAAPDAFIDGKVGPCTLRALTEAAMMHNAGQWSP